MKISDLTINKTYEIRDRNKTITIDSALTVAPEIYLTANREVVAVENNQYVKISEHGDKNYNFTHRLSTLLNRIVTLPAEYGGISMTVGQLAAAIEILTDELAYEFNHPVIITPPAPPVLPEAPQNLVAMGYATNEIMLSWDAVVGATTYEVFRDWVLIGSPVTNEFIDTELLPATTYTYAIKTVNDSGNKSVDSAIEEGTTLSA